MACAGVEHHHASNGIAALGLRGTRACMGRGCVLTSVRALQLLAVVARAQTHPWVVTPRL